MSTANSVSLPPLRLALFRFDLEALAPLRLPVFKGSTLRGGFGHIFKKTVCVQPQLTECAPCLLRHTCAYPYLFETSPPPGAEVLRKNESVPQPFVIEPPLDRRTGIPAGERLSFGVTLVGRAIGYLPYFMVVFRELGQAGLGHRTGKYALRGVSARHPYTAEVSGLYDGQSLLVQNGRGPIEISAETIEARAAQLPRRRLTVRFLTPARLKHAGEFAARPEFHVLIRALLRRISSLAYFHCGTRWETDFKGLIAEAERVRLAEARLSWMDWERWSSRQERVMNLGGLVGDAVYEGDLAPFLPLLAAGELLHAGKGTVFGNGLYRIVNSE